MATIYVVMTTVKRRSTVLGLGAIPLVWVANTWGLVVARGFLKHFAGGQEQVGAPGLGSLYDRFEQQTSSPYSAG